ncbi:hypothetical protein ACFQ71_02815 [Streptomyces sp. NPDC056534]|uniref:hypothetical protein n=1 Tax=Streptomyces sp. NPDC056534 TaxID=3345857 RepID=UPI0036B2721C
MSSSALPWYVKFVLRVAIPAACLAALYLSIPGEIAMARTAGWSEGYAYAMPVCVSVYALAAAAIAAYRRKANLPGQMTALIGAAMALALAICAQSISHLIQQNYMGSSAALVVAVSAVPPLVIAHMMHMAETPSQVRTADEEKAELRGMIDYLSLRLVDAISPEAGAMVSRSQAVTSQHQALTQVAEDLTEQAEKLVLEIEQELAETSRRGAGAVTEETVQAAAKRLRQMGEKVTVKKVCEVLGVSEATFYRKGLGKALAA